VFGALSKLNPPYGFSNTLCNTEGLSVARVEQQNAERLGKMSHKIRGADELGYLRRQSRFDPLLEAGFALGDIRLEETESEEVAIPSSAPGLSNEEMKEGFLPEQTRGRIKKGHDQAPFSLCPTLRRYPALMRSKPDGHGVSCLGTLASARSACGGSIVGVKSPGQ